MQKLVLQIRIYRYKYQYDSILYYSNVLFQANRKFQRHIMHIRVEIQVFLIKFQSYVLLHDYSVDILNVALCVDIEYCIIAYSPFEAYHIRSLSNLLNYLLSTSQKLHGIKAKETKSAGRKSISNTKAEKPIRCEQNQKVNSSCHNIIILISFDNAAD